LVTPVPNSAEANFLPGAAQLGQRGAGVALPAQEHGHLGLDRGLQQPGTEPGDLLQCIGQVSAGGEHLVDLGTQPLSGRYSC
jgi:hypothetical protein